MTSGPMAVIGLGLMGSRMSSHLLAAGHVVRGYDPDLARSAEFEDKGGVIAGSPAEAVAGCWAALLSLPTSDVSREVCLGGDGIAGAGVSPLFVYDTTTGRPDDAVEIAAALDAVGVVYSDTTVSGNSEVAEKGELVVMMGGSEDAYMRGRPIFEAIGRSHHHVGSIGSAVPDEADREPCPHRSADGAGRGTGRRRAGRVWISGQHSRC